MKFIKEIIPYVIILVMVVLIRSFVVTPVVVDGTSMDNTLHDGELLLLKKYDKSLERFDIIVFNYGSDKLVKRIIGLPGDQIKYSDGILYINNEKVDDPFGSITRDFELKNIGFDFIPKDYYFVLGDNRTKSSDSRVIGLVNIKNIQGTTTFSLWPFGKIKAIA